MAIQLVGKVSKALKDTGGASDDYKLLLQELRHLQVILEELSDTSVGAFGSLNHINAIKGMALAVQVPLQAFLKSMDKFRSTLGHTRPGRNWRQAGRQVQWSVTMQEEVRKLRATLTMKIATLSLLLALPTG